MKRNILMLIFSPLWLTAILLLIIADTILLPMYFISIVFYETDMKYYQITKEFLELT